MTKRRIIEFLWLLLIKIVVFQWSTKCVVLCGANSGSSTTTANTSNDDSLSSSSSSSSLLLELELECDLYVAKASNYDETGIGYQGSLLPISFYAGKSFKEGTTIPVYDMGIHVKNISLYTNDVLPEQLKTALWPSSEFIGSEHYEYNYDQDDEGNTNGFGFISGLGFSGTWNPGVINAGWDISSIAKRYSGNGSSDDDKDDPTGCSTTASSLDYRHDPMASSISEYFNYRMKATSDIPLGMEIFPTFGQNWLDFQQFDADHAIDDDGNEAPIPFKKQHDKALSIIREFSSLLNKYGDGKFDMRDAQYYWDFIRNNVVHSDETVLNLLPTDVTDLPILVDNDHPIDASSNSATVIRSNPTIQKVPGYLSNNDQATCSDNIVVKTSTIQGAGRGAFAKRSISKGSIVAPCPLLRLHSDILYIPSYEATDATSPNENDRFQLLTNYVFANTNLNNKVVFYPYGNGVNYINHASSAFAGSGVGNETLQPNVKMEWSKKEYHDMSLLEYELRNDKEDSSNPFVHIMDIVALRDIYEGDEILLDYGSDFDEELKSYQEQYFNSISSSSSSNSDNLPPSASILNEYLQGGKNKEDNKKITSLIMPLPTMEEQKTTKPLPENVNLMCFMDDRTDGSTKITKDNVTIMRYISDDIHFEKFSDIKLFTIEEEEESRYPILQKCDIVARSKKEDQDEYLYLIRLYLDGGDYPENKPYYVNVPKDVFLFVDMKESIELLQHLTNDQQTNMAPFRYPIGIPDDIFPKAWIHSDTIVVKDNDDVYSEEEDKIQRSITGADDVCVNADTC